MKKILIVEDKQSQQTKYVEELGGRVEIVAALSLAEAREAFEKQSPFDLVIVDACIDNEDEADSIPLVQLIRQSFSGPMIAASSHWPFRDALVAAGCTHQAPKHQAASMVLRLLQLV